MKAGIGAILGEVINRNCSDFINYAPVLLECCALMRGLCVHDDLRRDMSCAYENGKYFLKQSNLVQSLMNLSATYATHPSVASSALQAAKNLITTEEAVQIMTQHGAIELIRSILSYGCSSSCSHISFSGNDDNDSSKLNVNSITSDDIQSVEAVVLTANNAISSLMRAAVGLMRNICADDIRKDRIVSDGTLDLLIHIISLESYAKDSALMEHALACLAAISLRSPSNAQRIVSSGNALEVIARNMRRYADKSGLLRQGCLTVRNIAARCPELRALLLDAGFEEILRSAGRITDVVDEAYAALRDLGCEVHYVKVSADGKIEPVYEQFGARVGNNMPMRFNPIYDNDDEVISQRVREEARPPLAGVEQHHHVHNETCEH